MAQQEAEKARFLVEKAEQIKQASIISAEGDSEAAELLAKAFAKAGEGLVELRRIETAEDIALHMAGRQAGGLLREVCRPAPLPDFLPRHALFCRYHLGLELV